MHLIRTEVSDMGPPTYTAFQHLTEAKILQYDLWQTSKTIGCFCLIFCVTHPFISFANKGGICSDHKIHYFPIMQNYHHVFKGVEINSNLIIYKTNILHLVLPVIDLVFLRGSECRLFIPTSFFLHWLWENKVTLTIKPQTQFWTFTFCSLNKKLS